MGCEGPFGPVFGYPDPGPYTTDLIEQKKGTTIGIVDVFNTSDTMTFRLRPSDKVRLYEFQLWTGNDLSTIPVDKNGKPDFNEFPWKEGQSSKRARRIHLF